MSASTAPLVPRAEWDPGFVAGHPAHAVLARAAACFASATEWPAPSTWRGALETAGLADALLTESGVPIRFVDAPPKTKSRRRRAPVDVATIYDERIYARGEVPSRQASWHDFLNMLVWATFPAAKSALNARQRAALRAHIVDGAERLPGSRTREQDALAMLDEGGILVLAETRALVQVGHAVESANANALAERVRVGDAVVLAFGHALHEHLLSTDTEVRALALVLAVPAIPAAVHARVALADAHLHAALAGGEILKAPSGSPAMPVLGALFPAS